MVWTVRAKKLVFDSRFPSTGARSGETKTSAYYKYSFSRFLPAPPLVRTLFPIYSRGAGVAGTHFPGVPAEGEQTQGSDGSGLGERLRCPRLRAEALSIRVRVLPAQKLFQPLQVEPSSRIVLERLTGTFFVPQHSSVPRQQKTSRKRGPSPGSRAYSIGVGCGLGAGEAL